MIKPNLFIAIALAIPLFFSASAAAQSDSIADAYAKEFTYLKAQKSALQKRIDDEASNQRTTERRATGRLESLRSRFLDLSAQVNEKQLSLNRLQEDLTNLKGGENVVDSVLSQMQSTLGTYQREIGDNDLASATIANAFASTNALIKELSSMRKTEGVFYNLEGNRVAGQLIEVGNVAVFGVGTSDTLPSGNGTSSVNSSADSTSANGTSVDNSGALVPAGAGKLRLWEQPGSGTSALALAKGTIPTDLNVYLIENRDVEVLPPKEKTARSVIESGGIVGYIILGLGALGLLLAVMRLINLVSSGGSHRSLVRRMLPDLASGNIDGAWASVRHQSGSIPSVLQDVVRNVGVHRETMDDVISESILRENSRLDRFGALIIVIASVAPLLGLLGTVTGMISTFDLITEFGTGDPKLLADGISIALVTTMLGLAVAIPLLLVGNLLSGWARGIKDNMERAALLAISEAEAGHARLSYASH